jgi:hypothetical protein
MEEIVGLVRIPGRHSLSEIGMLHPGDDPVNDKETLRRRALAALHANVLPRVQPARTWGGNGSGERCCVCGQSIELDEKGLELEFAAAGAESAARAIHMHVPCFAAWKFARESAADGLLPCGQVDS